MMDEWAEDQLALERLRNAALLTQRCITESQVVIYETYLLLALLEKISRPIIGRDENSN
jgi:hypothetical protein